MASQSAQIDPPVPVSAAPRRRRRRLAVLGLLVVALLVGAVASQTIFSSSSSGLTIWQKITAGISADGSVPAPVALEAFAYDFKVSIPGVTVPAGVEGGDDPTDGTGPMRWVQASWNALTPAQRAVIEPFMGQQSGKHYKIGDPVAATGFELTAWKPPAVGPVSGPVPASFGSWPVDVTLAPDAPLDLAKAIVSDLVTDVAHIGPRLGLPVIDPGTPLAVNIALVVSDESGGDAAMITLPWQSSSHYEPCQITVYKNAWGGASVNGNGGVPPVLHVWLTHEVVHCYQNAVYASVATQQQIPAWINEGTAFYLAAYDTNIAEPHMPATWKDYFTPETPLTARSYDAYGYFVLLGQKGRDMWSLVPKGWAAAAAGASRSNAFIAVLDGDAADIVDNWAESYVRNADWNDPWVMSGFGLPDTQQVTPHDVQAQPDPGWTGSLDSRSNTILNVSSSSGEVVLVTTTGLASVHDQDGNSKIAFQTNRFCTVDSCVCPAGTLLAGQDMAPDHLTIPFIAALNAPLGGSTYAIGSAKLDDLCKRQATPQPTVNYGPCGANCSNSNGDPHMLTVNGFRYDFQAAGEFTLLRSADGSVDIQARQEPFQSSTAVSINTAIAAKVGSHKVGVYMVGSALQVHVDGQTATFASGPVELSGGGKVSAIENGFEVDFPDGTQLYAFSRGDWGIWAQIKSSDELLATAQGLLGPIVRGGLGVPALPDGTRLPAATDNHSRFATVYGPFADAWRITDAESLFDYAAGKTTASYTIKPFPVEGAPVTLSDLTKTQQAAGEAACSGVTDQALHDECAFDVGETGQTGFANGYMTVQGFYDGGVVAVAPSSSPARASITPAPGLVSGAWNVAAGSSVSGLAFGASDIVYADVQTGDNAFTLMALDVANQKILAQTSVPAGTEVHYAAGSVWLPGLEADANGNVCSVTRFDGQTLALLATVPVPCGYFGKPEMASDGSAMWFVDVSKFDTSTNKGATMTQLDPTTNAPSSTSAPLPFINGYRLDSQGAFFYFGTGPSQGYYRLTTGASAFDQLGQLSSSVGHAAGTGIWSASPDGKSASYYTSSGTPQATISIGGGLVAGDAGAAYVDKDGTDAAGNFVDQLWRYPIDGSAPTQIGTAPTIDGDSLAYYGDPMPVSNGDGVLKYWIKRDASNNWQLLVQWTPVK